MLTADGEVKILDLGLARLRQAERPVEEMTGAGQGLGTLDYMAPEQGTDSREVDHRADIYSLGCTLFKLLAGRAPFSGEGCRTVLEKLDAHAHRPPPSVCQCNPDVPAELAAVLERMLAKEPEARFTTAAEVAKALAPHAGRADLPALLARARGSEVAAKDRAETPSQPPTAVTAARGRHVSPLVAVALMLGGVGLGLVALEVLIRVQRNGQKVEITVPDKSRVDIGPDATVSVQLPAGTAAPTAVTARVPAGGVTAAAPNQFLRHALGPDPGRRVPDGGHRGRNRVGLAAKPGGSRVAQVCRRGASRGPTAPGEDHPGVLPGTMPGHAGRIRESDGHEPQRVCRPSTGHFLLPTAPERIANRPTAEDRVAGGRKGHHPLPGGNRHLGRGHRILPPAFARPRQRAAGRVYRLPTEAEWEYACRAGTTTRWSFGDDEKGMGRCGWVRSNSGWATHPVGEKDPNAWGLYDMYGNVRQWCQDWFAADYYRQSPQTDPPGPPTGINRVVRGGSFYTLPLAAFRSAARGYWSDGRCDSVGFRVACTTVEPPPAAAAAAKRPAPGQ